MQNLTQKATSINLFSFKGPHMRAFHITWLTFFLCFFGWFGIAPLMAIVRDELHLSKGQIGNIMIASVMITIFARLLIGYLCDRFGPRITYACLLLIGSIPVMTIGLSNSYESFLLFRLGIGIIGASFVITQYHTSVMFAPNIVGTANAITAGWGNLGGGVTQMVMPLVFAGFVALGYSDFEAWRLAMVVPGLALFVMAFVYYFFTQDTPAGNISDLKKQNLSLEGKKKDAKGSFWEACQDYRVWILFLIYGACFGIEITIDNIAALYFMDKFDLSLAQAGLIAGGFGMMNLFARALGGIFGDKAGNKYGLDGRVIILGIFLLLEGVFMIVFSRMDLLPLAIISMIVMAFFVKMSNGATYSVVPFINSKAIGSVAGIVGAGGNAGAVMAGFVFKSEGITYEDGLMYIGFAVIGIAMLTWLINLKKTSTPVENPVQKMVEKEEEKLEPALA